ncbi:ABC transporter substrate-binding protein [Paraglaciecola sp.]|uniref:substrate-binding periplasmic protein n=1 Tax=Paraglaciecola sp. TaxID=1920173 RepID=UPI0030F42A61
MRIIIESSWHKTVKNQPIFIFSILFCLMSVEVFAADLQFITHSSTHQTFVEKGKLRGKLHAGRRAFYVELIREMMAIMDVPQVIVNYPLARGIQYVQTKDNIAFFNVTRTAEREKSVKWVIQLLETESYFYELKDAPTGIKTLEDAKKVRAIGVVRGGVHESQLTAQGFNNLHALETYTQVLSMLIKGRTNLTASAGDFSTIQEKNLRLDTIQATNVKVFSSIGYLCFSNNVSDEVVKQWQQAFQQLNRSGKLQQITNDYLLPASANKTF